MANYFQILNDIDFSGKAKKKNGLSYLAWALAWAEVKKLYPNSFYTIYENADGWFYHTDGKTCWVKTGVTVVIAPQVMADKTSGEFVPVISGTSLEHVEYLPVMDFRNKSIPLDNVTSTDVNKAIQRSLTKACARHGAGLSFYIGEDIPDADAPTPAERRSATKTERINNLCKEHGVGLDVYSGILMSLRSSGEVPDKKTNDMNESEFGKMLSLVHEAMQKTAKKEGE